jgi:hypothetical protein
VTSGVLFTRSAGSASTPPRIIERVGPPGVSVRLPAARESPRLGGLLGSREATGQRFLAQAGALLASSLDEERTASRLAELAVRDIADFCNVDLMDAEGHLRRYTVASRDPSKASLGQVLMRVRSRSIEARRSKPVAPNWSLLKQRTPSQGLAPIQAPGSLAPCP